MCWKHRNEETGQMEAKIRHVEGGKTFRFRGRIYAKLPGDHAAYNAIDLEKQELVFIREDLWQIEFVRIEAKVKD